MTGGWSGAEHDQRRLNGGDEPVRIDRLGPLDQHPPEVLGDRDQRVRHQLDVDLRPELGLVGLRVLSPSTVSAAGPALLGIPPRRPETVTPAQARERHGVLPPTEAYARFRQLVVARKAPVGPEIEESIAVLGPVA